LENRKRPLNAVSGDGDDRSRPPILTPRCGPLALGQACSVSRTVLSDRIDGALKPLPAVIMQLDPLFFGVVGLGFCGCRFGMLGQMR
jgi:hypothetical protein